MMLHAFGVKCGNSILNLELIGAHFHATKVFNTFEGAIIT